MSNTSFNYIITIHNKESILERVLEGVAECAGRDALILPVLDGCTDGSEDIARKFASSSRIETNVLTAPDVHEIKTINIALREARPGYCIVIQDDIVLQQPNLESLVKELCEKRNHQLGYISFRLAADVGPTPLFARLKMIRSFGFPALCQVVNDYNHISNSREVLDAVRVDDGVFEERMVGIKGPVCLTPELRKVEPYLDEDLAPYCYDDVDLSLRSLKQGFINGLLPINFETRAEWSGTQKDPSYATYGNYVRWRNRKLIWAKHGEFILDIMRNEKAP